MSRMNKIIPDFAKEATQLLTALRLSQKKSDDKAITEKFLKAMYEEGIRSCAK